MKAIILISCLFFVSCVHSDEMELCEKIFGINIVGTSFNENTAMLTCSYRRTTESNISCYCPKLFDFRLTGKTCQGFDDPEYTCIYEKIGTGEDEEVGC